VWDVISPEKGNEVIAKWPDHQGQVKYYRVNISQKPEVTSATDEVIAEFPKGSLAGAVHAAAANKSRPWSNKLMDSVDDFKLVIEVNAYGTFLINACIADASEQPRSSKIVRIRIDGSLFVFSQLPVSGRRDVPQAGHRGERRHCQLCVGGRDPASRTMSYLRAF
jgi:NAD(P)-dependent dehydrogenase (short-subunit alcohol dehydrogenase family)